VENQKTESKIFFENLDVLRFLAAFIVLISHAYEGWIAWYGKPGFMTKSDDPTQFSTLGSHLDIGLINGGFGVDIFFMISGFLITFILLKEKEKFGKINISKFFVRRSLRIWPAYFLIIAIAPLCVKMANFGEPSYLPNLLFYNNFHTIWTGVWEYPFAHLWSICVEEHFYLFWPFIIAFIPEKYLKNTFITFIFISILSRISFSILGYYKIIENHNLYIDLHTISKIDVLVLGAFYALYYKNNGFTLKTSKYLRIIIYLIFLVVYFLESIKLNNSVFTMAVKKYFYCGIAGFAMINFIFNPDPLFKIPFKKILNYLGKISYGIYLFSNVLIPIIVVQIMYRFSSYNMYIYFLLNILLSIGISILVFELYEKQFLKLKKRFELVKTRRE
jgi:peptidoglycan/LPS O-acetylase OafA/YrhL